MKAYVEHYTSETPDYSEWTIDMDVERDGEWIDVRIPMHPVRYQGYQADEKAWILGSECDWLRLTEAERADAKTYFEDE